MTPTPPVPRSWKGIFFVLLFLVVFSKASPGGEVDTTPPRKPNVLFLMVDQMRGDCLGADGSNPVIRTPNLDRLAREGARFTHAYTSTPSCGPTRSALLTGLAPWNHGLLGAGPLSSDFERKMPQLFTEAGYQTVGIGSAVSEAQGFESVQRLSLSKNEANNYWAWFKEQAPDREPDETGLGPNSHRGLPFALPGHLHHTQWIGSQTVDFLEKYDGKRPFFLKASFFSPHSPYDAPQKYWDMYQDADIPKRQIGDWTERHAQRGKEHRDDLWQGDLGEEPARKARIGYYGNITFIDDQVGRILETLNKRGLLDDTLILFVSDHGDMLGDHHLWRKTYAYEPSSRIPMLMRWGKNLSNQPGGLVLSQPVEIRDILPTFLDAAGIKYEPEWFDGRSLLNLVRNPGASWREYIDLEHSACYDKNNNWTGLTDGKTKYIFYATEGREELFDLVADPHELHELSKSPEAQEKLALWRQRMIEHLQNRSEDYVKDGKLSLRPNGILYSPNHPSKKKNVSK